MNIWEHIEDYVTLAKKNDYFYKRRKEQAKYWMREAINNKLMRNFYENATISESLENYEQMVLEDKITSFAAAKKLLDMYYDQKK